MSDRIPGSSWSNPVWHRGWRIYVGDAPHWTEAFEYVHDDFDGAPDANDSSCGHASSVAAAKAAIDEWEEDRAEQGAEVVNLDEAALSQPGAMK